MEKILIIEDNHHIADFLADQVLPYLGYQAITAYSGEDALEILKNQHQHLSLVILDWQLPDMTGRDILKTMRDSNYALPAIILTGEGSEEIAINALRLGVEDYLIKPVNADTLGEAIDQALEKWYQRHQNTALTNRLKGQLSRLSALSKIGRYITSALSLDEVLRRVIDSATELVQADQGSLALIERPGEQLYLRAMKMSSRTQIEHLRVFIAIPQFSQVLVSKKPYQGIVCGDSNLRSKIYLPIFMEGEARGVLSVSRPGTREFDDEEEDKLVSLTDYAAIAIANAIEFERTQNDDFGKEQFSDLQKAIQRGEFILHYQPIVSFKNKGLIGFEALIRWLHPEKGVLLPDDFIPSAEKNGLIFDIDRWVMQKACQQLGEWQKASIAAPNLSVNVNISPDHLCEAGFLEYVEEIFGNGSLPPSSLKIEITERSVVERTDLAVNLINELLELGIQVMIDDFGSRYSSLGYLSDFPLEILKIDRSFIQGIHGDNRRREILNAIVALTDRLNVSVVAEGIETQTQLNYLKNLGCAYGQGFLFAKPLPADDVPAWLKTHKSQIDAYM